MLAIIPLELRQSQRRLQAPWANALILCVNVLAYLLLITLGWSWTCGRGTGLVSVLLYGFSHSSFWHLIGNMWCLFIFGNAVNQRIGSQYYLMAYLAAVVLVGLPPWLFMPTGVIGASGAVYAVIGMALLLLPSAKLSVGYIAFFPMTLVAALINRPRKPWQWMIRWDDFSVRMLWCLLLLPAVELWGLVTSGGGIWHLGHLLGLLVGIALVLLLPKHVSMKRPSAAAA